MDKDFFSIDEIEYDEEDRKNKRHSIIKKGKVCGSLSNRKGWR